MEEDERDIEVAVHGQEAFLCVSSCILFALDRSARAFCESEVLFERHSLKLGLSEDESRIQLAKLESLDFLRKVTLGANAISAGQRFDLERAEETQRLKLQTVEQRQRRNISSRKALLSQLFREVVEVRQQEAAFYAVLLQRARKKWFSSFVEMRQKCIDMEASCRSQLQLLEEKIRRKMQNNLRVLVNEEKRREDALQLFLRGQTFARKRFILVEKSRRFELVGEEKKARSEIVVTLKRDNLMMVTQRKAEEATHRQRSDRRKAAATAVQMKHAEKPGCMCPSSSIKHSPPSTAFRKAGPIVYDLMNDTFFEACCRIQAVGRAYLARQRLKISTHLNQLHKEISRPTAKKFLRLPQRHLLITKQLETHEELEVHWEQVNCILEADPRIPPLVSDKELSPAKRGESCSPVVSKRHSPDQLEDALAAVVLNACSPPLSRPLCLGHSDANFPSPSPRNGVPSTIRDAAKMLCEPEQPSGSQISPLSYHSVPRRGIGLQDLGRRRARSELPPLRFPTNVDKMLSRCKRIYCSKLPCTTTFPHKEKVKGLDAQKEQRAFKSPIPSIRENWPIRTRTLSRNAGGVPFFSQHKMTKVRRINNETTRRIYLRQQQLSELLKGGLSDL